MLTPLVPIAFLASAGLIEGHVIRPGAQLFRRQDQGSCLDPALIQESSALTGQERGTDGIKEGQAESATDENNFINFCQGKEITDGQQITTGSCNGIPMGNIPAVENMISAMITNPKAGSTISSDSTFDIMVQTTHLTAGNFVNPTTNYYTAPQDLDNNGDIIGHCHVTVQDIGSMDSTTPPDPSTFAFFKGIDDAGDGNGLLSATVDGGLPPGTYRVCTMIAAENHQPVAMPVAQRGAQDDCTKFEVVDDGTGGGDSQNEDQDMKQNQDEEGFVVDGDGVNDNEQGGQGGGDQGGDNGDQGDGGQGGNDGGQGNNNGDQGGDNGAPGGDDNQQDGQGQGNQGGNDDAQGGQGDANQGGNDNQQGGQEQGNQGGQGEENQGGNDNAQGGQGEENQGGNDNQQGGQGGNDNDQGGQGDGNQGGNGNDQGGQEEGNQGGNDDAQGGQGDGNQGGNNNDQGGQEDGNQGGNSGGQQGSGGRGGGFGRRPKFGGFGDFGGFGNFGGRRVRI